MDFRLMMSIRCRECMCCARVSVLVADAALKTKVRPGFSPQSRFRFCMRMSVFQWGVRTANSLLVGGQLMDQTH